MCEYAEDGSQVITIRDDLPDLEAFSVEVHEFGHARARTLLNDRSEHAARVWADAWHQAALQVHLGR